MIHQSLLNEGKTTRVMNAQAAGTSNVNSSSLDMANFTNVVFIASIGTITATAVTGIKAQESDDNSTWADLANTAVAVADTQSNKMALLEVIRPIKRYIRLVVTRGTANAVIDGVIAIQFAERKQPVTQDTTVAASEVWVSPVAGTA